MMPEASFCFASQGMCAKLNFDRSMVNLHKADRVIQEVKNENDR